MKSNRNAKALASLFIESENIKLSDTEMNQQLKSIGVDPDALVSEGLALVGKLTKVKSMKGNFSQMPIAASKAHSDEGINKSLKAREKRKPKGKSN